MTERESLFSLAAWRRARHLVTRLRDVGHRPRYRLKCWCGLEFTGRGRDGRLSRHMRTHPREWGW